MGKKGKAKGGAKAPARKDIAQNRKALHEYEILDRYEAGIALTGTEVKGLRESGAMIREAYAQVINGEVFLV
ncbi:MAG: SsrA-binding protein, partial [Miltoncostaeaceae bacterium]